MRAVFGFFSGLIFGLGLVISGLTDPAKVLNFLDLAGKWDPSLALVMGSAVMVTYVGYRLILRQSAPVLGEKFDLPSNTRIDRPLVIGAALFGVGWGIGGLCPGPAWAALPLLAPGVVVFLAMMLAGLWLASRAKAVPSLASKGAYP